MRILFLFTPLVVLFLIAACGGNKKTIAEVVIPKATEDIQVRIETPYGNMVAELYDETPLHRDNFMKLVDSAFYDSLLFHRVMRNFMVQGGDPQSKGAAKGKRLGVGGPGYTVPSEFLPQFYHKKGALSAARQPDNVNPQKNSSGSQFYIVQGNVYDSLELKAFVDKAARMGKEIAIGQEAFKAYTSIGGTPHLDGEYTVFGEIIEGLNVIDSIALQRVDRNNRPLEDISMKIIRLN